MFGRRWFATALIVPYMLPSWTFALAWRTLFRNRTVGGQQGWMESLGFTPPDWLAYGQLPITIILARKLQAINEQEAGWLRPAPRIDCVSRQR